jgi:hypothetical protein
MLTMRRRAEPFRRRQASHARCVSRFFDVEGRSSSAASIAVVKAKAKVRRSAARSPDARCGALAIMASPPQRLDRPTDPCVTADALDAATKLRAPTPTL